MARWVLLIIIFQTALHGQFSGYVKTYSYLIPYNLEWARLGVRLQTVLDNEINESISFHAVVNFEAENPTRADAAGNLFVQPVEMYIDWVTKLIDLRIGQQFIFWGSTEWINPTDIINPWDYTRLSGEIEDYRVPMPAISATANMGELQLQLVGLPVFRPSQLGIPFEKPAEDFLVPFREGMGGFRLTSFYGMTDISVSYFLGYENIPDVIPSLKYLGDSLVVRLNAQFPAMAMVGIDFTRSMGKFNLNAEAAWLKRLPVDMNDPRTRNPSAKVVGGIDYTPSDRFSINGQVFYEQYLSFDAFAEGQYVKNLGMTGIIKIPDEVSQGVSGRIAINPTKSISAEGIGVYNFNDGDFMLLGFLTWDVADAAQLIFGGMTFEGPDYSPFGRSTGEDKVFLEFKVSF